MKGFPATPTIERVLPRLEWEGDCLVWTGAQGSNGYGVVRERVAGKRTQTGVHRVVYRDTIGPIPSGLYVCHTCDNPPCCNPEHLWVGSPSDNQFDCVEKERRAYPKTTKCRSGRHEFTPENTYVFPNGRRLCRACHAETQRKNYLRRTQPIK